MDSPRGSDPQSATRSSFSAARHLSSTSEGSTTHGSSSYDASTRPPLSSPPSSSFQHVSKADVDVPTPDEEAGLVLIRAYTLQHAESGLGNDYLKRRNVIRVRVEGEQFLMQAQTVWDVVRWIEALHAGADVALPLEHARKMPRGPLFPRRRRRRRGVTAITVGPDAQVVAASDDIDPAAANSNGTGMYSGLGGQGGGAVRVVANGVVLDVS
ncbi:hypothetical protein CYLTODRAFT_355361 [Cylindrobasidium torrendii FP15055 ss-10]|uniref:PH domain-containing protein n=1 Tax=Cylindrobasidium torrendii FP15055 ss-10 TaxID=1314674 RepID=A0A0D7B7V3_9AGAR|nr:hypothetical protein CYLTODRAFT_355361 [Cylindrobasidium torrendii FP15055 ss-10]